MAANTSAISTMVSKIHPGIAPGQSKAVERDTERNAKVAIVRATHNLKGDQGSRLGYNDGNQSSGPSLMTRSSSARLLILLPLPKKEALIKALRLQSKATMAQRLLRKGLPSRARRRWASP